MFLVTFPPSVICTVEQKPELILKALPQFDNSNSPLKHSVF